MKKYLASEQQLKEYANINIQMDSSKLKVSLNKMDFHFVQQLLGTRLYKLFSDFVNGVKVDGQPITLTPAQAACLEIVKRYFAYLVHWDLVGESPFQTVNKGSIVPEGGASIDLLKYERDRHYNFAEGVKSAILKHIEANREDFKDYWAFPEVGGKKDSSDYSPIVFD